MSVMARVEEHRKGCQGKECCSNSFLNKRERMNPMTRSDISLAQCCYRIRSIMIIRPVA